MIKELKRKELKNLRTCYREALMCLGLARNAMYCHVPLLVLQEASGKQAPSAGELFASAANIASTQHASL